MISVSIPGFRDLRLAHLVLDYNGTLALDGLVLAGVREALVWLSAQVHIHVITADTFGLAAAQLGGLPLELLVLGGQGQAEAKRDLVLRLGAEHVVAIGNGRNDRMMLEAAALGIALVQKEGGAVEALAKADVASSDILDALDLLRHPQRLVATLRS